MRIFFHHRVSPWHLGLGASLIAALLVLASCGGGAAGTSNTPAGTLSLSATDGPSSDFDHAYVTISYVSLHTSATAVDFNQSPGWVSINLPSNLTVDLNHLSNGALAAVLNNAGLPAAAYSQIRLGLLPWDDPLVSSAQNTLVNGQPLLYNETVVEANGTQYPLEISNPAQGLALIGSFTVLPNQSVNWAVELNAGDDIVRFHHGAGYGYLLNPTLHGYDLNQSGTITGNIACTPLCSSFVVKAEQPSSDNSYHQVARWTNVKADGSFTLYPLAVSGSTQTYDIVVRGHNAQTTIIESVPVTQNGTTVLAAAATPVPVLATTEYTTSNTATYPTSTSLQFYQTIPGKAPYEIRTHQTDPFTGTLLTPEPVVSGNLQVGPYQSNGNPGATLASITPQEGSGAYQVWQTAPYFTRTQASSISPSVTTITPPASPTLGSGVTALGNVTIHLTAATPNRWDHGQVVMARFGAIANTVDISSLVGQGGDVSVGGLPSGTMAQPFPLGYYFAYLRLWNSSASAPNQVRIVQISGDADMRQTSSVALSATLP